MSECTRECSDTSAIHVKLHIVGTGLDITHEEITWGPGKPRWPGGPGGPSLPLLPVRPCSDFRSDFCNYALTCRDAEPKSRRRAAEREMEWEERPEGQEGQAGQEARADSTPLQTLRHLVGPSVPERSPCREYIYTCM